MTGTIHVAGTQQPSSHATIDVRVIYVAAAHPYEESQVPSTETLAIVKANALRAFHLTEGQLPDGRTRTFKLFHGREELPDLSRTIGEVADHAEKLDLKLTEHVVQGNQ